jgi:type IV secretory pathway protease TraF
MNWVNTSKNNRFEALCLTLLLLPFFALVFLNIGLRYDRQPVRCLSASLYFLNRLAFPQKGDFAELDGDYLARASERNRYMQGLFVGKQVVGVSGDVVDVNADGAYVNGTLVAKGLGLADIWFHQSPSYFYKHYVIPEHRVFVVATHPYSNDSRYWGPVPDDAVTGRLFPLY